MVTLADLQSEYKLALQDLGDEIEKINEPPDNSVRDAAIRTAINWYSRRLPLIKTVLIAASGARFYAVPVDFIAGSRIISVEFPLDQTPPNYLVTPKDIRMQRRDTGRFYYLDPNPDGQFRLTYTTQHPAAAPADIPDQHLEPLAKMAASVGLLEFANRYANTVGNNVDAINYRSKSQEFTKAAKEMREQVERELRRDELAHLRETDPFAFQRKWRP